MTPALAEAHRRFAELTCTGVARRRPGTARAAAAPAAAEREEPRRSLRLEILDLFPPYARRLAQ